MEAGILVASRPLAKPWQAFRCQLNEPAESTLVVGITTGCAGITRRVDVLEAAKVRADGLAGRGPGVGFAALPGSPPYATVLVHEGEDDEVQESNTAV